MYSNYCKYCKLVWFTVCGFYVTTQDPDVLLVFSVNMDGREAENESEAQTVKKIGFFLTKQKNTKKVKNFTLDIHMVKRCICNGHRPPTCKLTWQTTGAYTLQSCNLARRLWQVVPLAKYVYWSDWDRTAAQVE